MRMSYLLSDQPWRYNSHARGGCTRVVRRERRSTARGVSSAEMIVASHRRRGREGEMGMQDRSQVGISRWQVAAALAAGGAGAVALVSWLGARLAGPADSMIEAEERRYAWRH